MNPAIQELMSSQMILIKSLLKDMVLIVLPVTLAVISIKKCITYGIGLMKSETYNFSKGLTKEQLSDINKEYYDRHEDRY